MKKTILFTILSVFLFARENPFVPAEIIKKFEEATNETKTYPPFSSKEISLPSSARVLKEIVIKYQNVDGSESLKKISINESIDWHKPLVIAQKEEILFKDSNASETTTSKEAKKGEIKEVKKEQKSAEQKSAPKPKKLPKASTKKEKSSKISSKTIKINRFLTVKLEGNKIYLFTKNRKIRDFMIAKPYKIVMDFYNLVDIKSKIIRVGKVSFVKKIVVGNHTNYFRVVFELDGNYRYSIKKISNGYLLLLK